MASSPNTSKPLVLKYLNGDPNHFHTAAEVAKAIKRSRWTAHYALHDLYNDGQIKARTFEEKKRTTACYGTLETEDTCPVKMVRMAPQIVVQSIKLATPSRLATTPVHYRGGEAAWLQI